MEEEQNCFQHQPSQSASVQPKVADPAVDHAPAQSSDNSLLILNQRRHLPAVVRHQDRDPFAEDEDSFSIDLDNEVVLREKLARSEVLDRVAEFCGLARANAETTKEVMGMQRAIKLAITWHNSTTQIAQRNYEIVNGRLSKSMKSLNPAKPWGLRDHFTGSGYYTHNAEGYIPKPESLLEPSRPLLKKEQRKISLFYIMFPATLTIL